jgi:hypothetical protein
MQVLPSCSVRVEGQLATVDCPAGMAYTTNLSPSAPPVTGLSGESAGQISAALPDGSIRSASPGTLTIRY